MSTHLLRLVLLASEVGWPTFPRTRIVRNQTLSVPEHHTAVVPGMHDFRHTAGCGQEWNDCGIGCVSCDLYGDAIGRRRQIPEKEVMPRLAGGENDRHSPGRGDGDEGRAGLLRIESDGAGCYGSKVKLAICLKTRLRLSRFGDKPAALRRNA